MHGDFGSIQHLQKFFFVVPESSQCQIEGDESGFSLEYAIEPGLEAGFGSGCWVFLVGLEITIQPPDQRLPNGNLSALFIGNGENLVDGAFRMDPTQCVVEHIELTGVIADDDRFLQKSVMHNASHQRALGRDLHRVGMNFQVGDAKRLQMVHPAFLIRKPSCRMARQHGYHLPGQVPLGHVGQGLGMDDIIAMAGPQDFEKISAAFGIGGRKPGKVIIADLSAISIGRFVPGSRIIDRDPPGGFQAGSQNSVFLRKKIILAIIQDTNDLPLGDLDSDIVQTRYPL